jgi:hypothetical protein
MAKLTFPMGIKTILSDNKRVFIKAQPFMFQKEIKQFKELFNPNITKTKNKKTKHNKTKRQNH